MAQPFFARRGPFLAPSEDGCPLPPLPLLSQLSRGWRGLPAVPPPCPGPSASKPSPWSLQPPPSVKRAKPAPPAAPSDSCHSRGVQQRRKTPNLCGFAPKRSCFYIVGQRASSLSPCAVAPCIPQPSAAINQSDTAILRSFTGIPPTPTFLPSGALRWPRGGVGGGGLSRQRPGDWPAAKRCLSMIGRRGSSSWR